MTVSQRGVVFFRAQDALDDKLQKELAQRLGELMDKPSSSKLHIHPVSNAGREGGGDDDEISIISSVQAKKLFKKYFEPQQKKQSGKEGWHSDITFEPVPSDYAILRLVELPGTGGGMIQTQNVTDSLYQVLTEIVDRYPVGIRLRTLRSHLQTLPEVSRDPHCHICAAHVRRIGQKQ